MNKWTLCILTLVVALLSGLGFENGKSDSKNPGTGYFPIPDTVDYPMRQSTIDGYIKTENMAEIRRHGWNLFHGLQQSVKVDGIPGVNKLSVWQTWYSVTQGFSATKAPITKPAYTHLRQKRLEAPAEHMAFPSLAALNAANSPVLDFQDVFDKQKPQYPNMCKSNGKQIQCPDGTIFANNDDIMIAGEYFNWEAFNHLRGKGLYRQSVLSKMLEEGKTDIPTFPRKSIVLKSMHWPIAADGTTALPVWDNDPLRPPYQYNGYEVWKRAVAVDPSGKPIPPAKTATVKSLFGVKVPGVDTPRTFSNAKVVPLSDFYHLRITPELWGALDDNDKAILNQSANWAYQRDFRPGDYIALIAFHIITKENEPWCYQSFWWHDQPDVGPFAENRPNLPAGPWQNYLMTTAYNQVTPREYDGTEHVAYNPYIELVIHPMPTNCMNCHARAGYPIKEKQLHPPDQTNFAAYDDSPSGRHEVLPNSPALKGLLRTDYLWIITDRAIHDE